MSHDAGKDSRPRIGPGYRIGHLTVAHATEERHSGYTVWQCSCDCGGAIKLDTRRLQRGTITDCGCLTSVKPGTRDLTGLRFGRLLCLEQTEQRIRTEIVWRCRCDCGKEVSVPVRQLTGGYVKSCGCLGHPPLKNFTGKRFGKLTVTGYVGKQAGMHRWKCLCDCGKESIVGQTLLQCGKTKSCGCLQAQALKRNLKLFEGTSITKLESLKGRRLSSNTSGYTGVYRQKTSGKWIAQITFKGKTYYLGSYADIHEAVNARKRAEDR